MAICLKKRFRSEWERRVLTDFIEIWKILQHEMPSLFSIRNQREIFHLYLKNGVRNKREKEYIRSGNRSNLFPFPYKLCDLILKISFIHTCGINIKDAGFLLNANFIGSPT